MGIKASTRIDFPGGSNAANFRKFVVRDGKVGQTALPTLVTEHQQFRLDLLEINTQHRSHWHFEESGK